MGPSKKAPRKGWRLDRAASSCARKRTATTTKVVQWGLPSTEPRDEHRADLPDAFVCLERATEETVSPLK